MRARRIKIDSYQVRANTSMARRTAEEAIKSAQDYEADSRCQERLEVHECKCCFYLRSPRIGGATMTHWQCGVCGEESLHGSTATPCVCLDCAKEHRLCTHCGGDLDMREGRRKFPTPVEDTP